MQLLSKWLCLLFPHATITTRDSGYWRLMTQTQRCRSLNSFSFSLKTFTGLAQPRSEAMTLLALVTSTSTTPNRSETGKSPFFITWTCLVSGLQRTTDWQTIWHTAHSSSTHSSLRRTPGCWTHRPTQSVSLAWVCTTIRNHFLSIAKPLSTTRFILHRCEPHSQLEFQLNFQHISRGFGVLGQTLSNPRWYRRQF